MGDSYNPSKRTLEEYIMHCKEEGIPPTFIGPESFFNLTISLNGKITPNISFIRILKDETDEHYLIGLDGKLKGIILPKHSGKPGIHEPEKILLDNTVWQLENIKL
ncbi:MAG: hypothetical protein ISS82_02390 [Nanoarchaeota archaeon]|nr:hypothetical protein [Nanoarchaeota archaeon]